MCRADNLPCIAVVFTTFLILFESGMVVTNVVWYWYEFDCLIPEGSRDMGS